MMIVEDDTKSSSPVQENTGGKPTVDEEEIIVDGGDKESNAVQSNPGGKPAYILLQAIRESIRKIVITNDSELIDDDGVLRLNEPDTQFCGDIIVNTPRVKEIVVEENSYPNARSLEIRDCLQLSTAVFKKGSFINTTRLKMTRILALCTLDK